MFIQQIINGLTLGSVYALIALGYTMVYGVIELINFAHGEIFMVGAYMGILSIYLLGMLKINPVIIVILTFIFSMILVSILGFSIEKIAYKPLRKSMRLTPLITALGVSIFLQNIVMLVAGTDNKSFPQIINQSHLQMFIIAISLILMLGLEAFVFKTKLGKAMRATSSDIKTASFK